MVLLHFLERRIHSDFTGLNVTSHFSAQRWILARSKFNCSAACMGSSTMKYKLVSSAKSLIDELMSTKMSIIYKRNRRGPRIEPCGTPALTEVQKEFIPGKTTRCLLSVRYSENQVSNDPETTADLSLKRRPLCQTLSKALLISQNIARTSLPSSRALQNEV